MFIELRGYEVRYDKNRAFTILRLVAAIPKILIRIKREKAWLGHFAAREGLDLVISDNRYGLAIPGIPCIFITHQLLIKTPLGSWADRLLQWLNYRAIGRFSRCWIPDIAVEGLGGELSHPRRMPSIPTRYIGWLSRFDSAARGDLRLSPAAGDRGISTGSGDQGTSTTSGEPGTLNKSGDPGTLTKSGDPDSSTAWADPGTLTKPGDPDSSTAWADPGTLTKPGDPDSWTTSGDDDLSDASPAPMAGGPFLLALLSGPEPQRTLLEKAIVRQAMAFAGKPPPCRLVLIRGLPGNTEPPLDPAAQTSSTQTARSAPWPLPASAPSPLLASAPSPLPASAPSPLPPWLTTHNHLPAAALEPLLRAASLVLARPGYSTVMDLERLGKRAIFIPTPGQTEQEYLGPYLAAKGWAASVDQHAFSLAKAFELAVTGSSSRECQPEPPGLLAAEIKTVLQSLENPSG